MDGNIDKVREALDWVDSVYGETVIISDARAALSAIDSDAIRAAALKDAADRAVSWQVKLCSRDDWHCEGCTECNQLRYAILSAEPAQDDGKPDAFASAIVKELRVNWAFDTEDALSVLNGAKRRLEEAEE